MKDKNIFWLIATAAAVVVLIVGVWLLTSLASGVADNDNLLLAQSPPPGEYSPIRSSSCSQNNNQATCDDTIDNGGVSCEWFSKITERFICEVDAINPCGNSTTQADCTDLCRWRPNWGGQCVLLVTKLPNCQAKTLEGCLKNNVVALKKTGGRYGCKGSTQLIDRGRCQATCSFGQAGASCKRLSEEQCSNSESEAAPFCQWIDIDDVKGGQCAGRMNCSAIAAQLGGGGGKPLPALSCERKSYYTCVTVGDTCQQADGRECSPPPCGSRECRLPPSSECVPIERGIIDSNHDGICERVGWDPLEPAPSSSSRAMGDDTVELEKLSSQVALNTSRLNTLSYAFYDVLLPSYNKLVDKFVKLFNKLSGACSNVFPPGSEVCGGCSVPIGGGGGVDKCSDYSSDKSACENLTDSLNCMWQTTTNPSGDVVSKKCIGCSDLSDNSSVGCLNPNDSLICNHIPMNWDSSGYTPGQCKDKNVTKCADYDNKYDCENFYNFAAPIFLEGCKWNGTSCKKE